MFLALRYGQTNCFVGPKLKYGFYATNESQSEVYVVSGRAARNMAFQGITQPRGVVHQVSEIEGSALVGTKIKAPFGVHDEVYVLPMENVLATKVRVLVS